MCKLVMGAVADKGAAKVLNEVASLASIGNRDAWGIAVYLPGEGLFLHKGAGPYPADTGGAFLREHIAPGALVLIHLRLATSGNPQDNRNNHPFVKPPLVGIHNGVVFDALRMEVEEGLQTEGECDSEALIALLAKGARRSGKPEDWFAPLRKYWLTYAVGLIDLKRGLLVAANGNQYLHLARTRWGTLASTDLEDLVEVLWRRSRWARVSALEAQGAILSPKGVVRRFPVPRPSPPKYKGWVKGSSTSWYWGTNSASQAWLGRCDRCNSYSAQLSPCYICEEMVCPSCSSGGICNAHTGERV